MEYLSLNGQNGVADFKVSTTIKDSLALVMLDNNEKRLKVAKGNSTNTEVLDYLNYFKQRWPDVRIVPCETSEIIELAKKSNDTNIDQSDIQKQVVEIVQFAVAQRASDIHIRMGEKFTRIYFRIDGRLRFFEEYRGELAKLYVSALFQTMCEGGSSTTFNYSIPLDAKVKESFVSALGLSGGRFSSRPKNELVIVVIRLLKKRDKALSLVELGMEDKQRRIIERVISKSCGVVFMSGPTNSGKSTLAQSMCETVTSSDSGIHLITVEDPIENTIRDAVQTPLMIADRSDPKKLEKAWGDAITNILRLDPDQIFIGEVRDNTSATGAITAALTGHKVFTTIHTNFPIDIIARLKNLGVESDLIADSSLIICLIGQRLAPLLCHECKLKYSESKDSIATVYQELIEKHCNVNSVFIENSKGCEHCNYTGLKGMKGVFEIIETDAEFMHIYHEMGKTKAYEYWYKSGGVTLCSNTISLINNGEIDPVYAHSHVCNIDRDSLVFTQSARASVSGKVYEPVE